MESAMYFIFEDITELQIS